MSEQHSRTEMMLGEDGLLRLRSASVAVFGIGGVGGFAVEALARSGVGELHLIDSDRVVLSNINRQIIATHATVGEYKTLAARERIASINPEAKVYTYELFFDKSTRAEFDFSRFDYIIDAIDSLSAKVELIATAKECGVPIISAMGAGNKLDPTAFEVSDIAKTSVCPLARAVRVALRKRDIHHLKVVYSKEPPHRQPTERGDGERTPPGSISFVPSVMGLILAGEVIKDIAIKE